MKRDSKIRAKYEETKRYTKSNNVIEINQIIILCTVCHLCPYGARFVSNCYHHWSLLILRNGNGTAIFLHTSEGVMQGGYLTMFAYSIGILPLIKNLKREIPDITQPWYADDSGALGTFARIDTYFNLLTCQGPQRGYHPKPSKRVMVMHPDNLEARKYFGKNHGFKVCTGARYLGVYIGVQEQLAERVCAGVGEEHWDDQ